jgi:hypothetical protein
MTKITIAYAKENITWLDRFQMMDALNGYIVSMGDGSEARIEADRIYLPQYGPVKLLNYSDDELRDFVKRVRPAIVAKEAASDGE